MRAQVGQAANPATDGPDRGGWVSSPSSGSAASRSSTGEKSLGEFMSFFTALGLMFEPLRRLSNVAGQVQASLASLERIYTALDAPATVLRPRKPRADGARRHPLSTTSHSAMTTRRCCGAEPSSRARADDRARRTLGRRQDHGLHASDAAR
jgi:ABC-type multidrug transport system fused ATPase/permease subunit